MYLFGRQSNKESLVYLPPNASHHTQSTLVTVQAKSISWSSIRPPMRCGAYGLAFLSLGTFSGRWAEAEPPGGRWALCCKDAHVTSSLLSHCTTTTVPTSNISKVVLERISLQMKRKHIMPTSPTSASRVPWVISSLPLMLACFSYPDLMCQLVSATSCIWKWREGKIYLFIYFW